MRETQYNLFRDLDRHCVTGGFKESDCREVVERKKQSISASINQENEVVREVLEGKNTFAGVYDEFSRSYRGLRRFIPHPLDEAANARLEALARVIPNVGHFRTRSIFAADNPISCTVYGVIVGLAADLVWVQQVNAMEGEGALSAAAAVYFFGVGFGFAGFVTGAVAMLRYRTRDAARIHAREAADYMDLNYRYYRNGDDEGWAHFIRAAGGNRKTAPGVTG